MTPTALEDLLDRQARAGSPSAVGSATTCTRTSSSRSTVTWRELRRTPEGWKLTRVQPNVQFIHDPDGAAARMFPADAG